MKKDNNINQEDVVVGDYLRRNGRLSVCSLRKSGMALQYVQHKEAQTLEEE